MYAFINILATLFASAFANHEPITTYDIANSFQGSGLNIARRRPVCAPTRDWDTVGGRCLTNSMARHFSITCKHKSSGRQVEYSVNCASQNIFRGWDSNQIYCSMNFDRNRPMCIYQKDDDSDSDDGQNCGWSDRSGSSGSGKWSGTAGGQSSISNVACGRKRL